MGYNNDGLWKAIGCVILFLIVAALGFWSYSSSQAECERTARPACIDTPWYDGEGECECNTEQGELEWNIGGCAAYLDD